MGEKLEFSKFSMIRKRVFKQETSDTKERVTHKQMNQILIKNCQEEYYFSLFHIYFLGGKSVKYPHKTIHTI